MKYGGLAQLV